MQKHKFHVGLAPYKSADGVVHASFQMINKDGFASDYFCRFRLFPIFGNSGRDDFQSLEIFRPIAPPSPSRRGSPEIKKGPAVKPGPE